MCLHITTEQMTEEPLGTRLGDGLGRLFVGLGVSEGRACLIASGARVIKP